MKRAYMQTLFFLMPACLLSACGGSSSGGANGGGTIPSVVTPQTVSLASPAALPLIPAISASAFVDSIGVNTHFNYPAYSNSFSTLKSLLVSSGIRHIRDGFVSNPPSAFVYFGYLKQLQSSGVRATMETTINLPVATILANTQAVPNFTEAIEAPNEYNLSGDPSWATNLAAYQQTLYTGAKATPGLATLPILGPALTTVQAYAQVGNLSAYMDYGNMHDYFAGFNPGTTGYGGGGFGSVYGTIAYNQGEAAQTDGTKPAIATETGYCTVPNTRNAVTPVIESKYIPRMFLEQWLAHVPRTFEYELIDEGGGGCGGTYGLITGSLTPKPGYYALQSLIQSVNDASLSAAASLPLSIASSSSTVHHLLMQKSDGSYILALWNEVPSWNVNDGTGTPLTPAPIPVTLQLAATPSTSTMQSIGDDGALHTQVLTWTQGSTALSIDDHVTLLTFMP